MRLISQWASPEMGARSLRLRWRRTSQRYCVQAPWGRPALQSDFWRGLLNFRRQGARIPLRADRAGR